MAMVCRAIEKLVHASISCCCIGCSSKEGPSISSATIVDVSGRRIIPITRHEGSARLSHVSLQTWVLPSRSKLSLVHTTFCADVFVHQLLWWTVCFCIVCL